MTFAKELPSAIRSDQALAALKIGFLLRRIEHESIEIWKTPILERPDLEGTSAELNSELIALSHRINGFEDQKLAELQIQISNWSFLVFTIHADWIKSSQGAQRDLFRQNFERDPAVSGLQKIQNDRRIKLRTIVANIMNGDPRLVAWSTIGDMLGNLIFKSIRGELTVPLPQSEVDKLFSGVKRLPTHLQKRVMPFFPDPNRENRDLAAELLDTYHGLCGLVNRLSPMAIPHWDGSSLHYRQQSVSIRVQSNSVIVPILNEFESHGWPSVIKLEDTFEGDVKQAILKLRKTELIKISQIGNRIHWSDPGEN